MFQTTNQMGVLDVGHDTSLDPRSPFFGLLSAIRSLKIAGLCGTAGIHGSESAKDTWKYMAKGGVDSIRNLGSSTYLELSRHILDAFGI